MIDIDWKLIQRIQIFEIKSNPTPTPGTDNVLPGYKGVDVYKHK